MTKAAEDLFVAQSSVSAAVAHLERELKVQLFLRVHAKGLVLTPAGTELLAGVHRVFDDLGRSFDQISGGAAGAVGVLDVICFATLSPFYLPSVLADLRAHHPDLEVRVEEATGTRIAEALERGSAEVALSYKLGLGSQITTELLETRPPFAVLSRGHRLASRQAVGLEELAGEPMVLLDLPLSRDYFLDLFRVKGLSPDVRFRTTSFETVRSLVAEGHGFALMHQRTRVNETYSGQLLVTIPLTGAVEPLDVVLATKAGRLTNRRVEVFAEACRRVTADAG